MDKPASSLVPGGGARSPSGPKPRGAEEGETKGHGGGGGGFLDLSLGSIYHDPSSLADDDRTPVTARVLLPVAAPLDASGALPYFVVAAATAASALPTPPAFALELASSALAVPDGSSAGALASAAVPSVVAANAPPAPPAAFALGLLASPAAVAGGAARGGNDNASGAASPLSAPPFAKRKLPRGRRVRDNNAASGRRNAHAPIDGAPPFPLATTTAASHPTLAQLSEQGIAVVEGEVRCKRCDAVKTMAYDVRAKFEELSGFIVRNVESMHDRAPLEWLCPALPDCDRCGQKNSLRPVIAAEKERINWMFMLLGQTLGLCTLEQLKHFCARTRQHRTGAKDRVLYSTYMELCNQLCPGGPFDMASQRKNRSRRFG